MSGIPYWGEQTFLQLEEVIGSLVPSKSIDVSGLTTQLNTYGVMCEIIDVYSLFKSLAYAGGVFLVYDNEYDKYFASWCRDIKFNYRDRLCFIPYYTYDTGIVELGKTTKRNFLDIRNDDEVCIKYNIDYRRYTVFDRDTGERNTELVVYFPLYGTCFRVDFGGIPYFAERPSLSELHQLYKACALYTGQDDEYLRHSNDYIPTHNRYKNNDEYVMRRRLGLPHFLREYVEYRYTDVRLYNYKDYGVLSEIVEYEKELPYRTLEFEAYLFCLFASELLPVDADSSFEELGKTVRTITIGDKFPLVLKYYYKNNPSLRRKTYERYLHRLL